MGQFIVEEKVEPGFVLCGRIIKENENLVVFVDEVGRFEIPGRVLVYVLAGLGDEELSWGRVRLSVSGRGVYLDIKGVRYAIPVTRVRAVMEGKNRKGPVSLVR
ncbi:hypothetical protein [Methanospirillum lacunae]|uniref:Uncharacterized protein n=1 Tax=Methanospirillum lacunae TaxID=668570 RepID=A0A2V2N3I4_9EURY|nr:hypothetical protein [Methanospirillum lacunae]PWR74339.1 hypothetical protein DK846_04105 [Methanospirillum lacunae]